MIVRPAGDGTLLLITQPDHARLAAAIVSAWNAEALVPPALRTAVLFAIEQHDNGWREVDAAPAVNAETGRPFDFMDTPPDVKQGIWPRGVRRLAADSPLAAALVSQHALALYAHRRDDPGWRTFFSTVEDLRTELLRACGAETGPAREAFDRSYDLLYLGDVLSLVFCNRWKDPIDVRGYRVTLAEDGGLLVSPDPFGGASIRFAVPARSIPDRRYSSTDDLRAALAQAAPLTLHGTARGC